MNHWDQVASANSTIRFCERWLEKARPYDASELDDAFDKFFTLFVAYNRLYSHLNRFSGTPGRRDKAGATTQYLAIVGSKAVMRSLENAGGSEDLHRFTELITTNEFWLIGDDSGSGEHPTKNGALREKLRSDDDGTRALGILESLYYIRCNMFHGSKDFEHRQLLLLEPATRILERLIVGGLDAVRSSAV